MPRAAATFGLVFALYWAYALVAVPFIEPTADARPDVVTSDADLQRAAQAYDTQRSELAYWFQPGDWEMNTPKILENNQGMLLVNEYQNLGNGRVRIKPCTMIFLPEGKFESEADRRRQAIVLQAPEGAELQFDSPIDLKQAKLGKLIGGHLTGEVRVRSDQKQPGPHDDLHILTRDVELSEQLISTPHDIDFQLGPNRGHGRRMRLAMTPGAEKQRFRGLTSLELSEQVALRLMPQGAELFPGGAQKPADDGRAQLPVEVRCQGPFRFDFDKCTGTFHDQVDVLRINPNGPGDQLTGELLTIFFATASESASGSAASAATLPVPAGREGKTPKLQPVRVEAFGNPVLVRAPSNGAQARGQQLEYDIKTGSATLRGEPHVDLVQGNREIHAPEVFFQPDKTGRLGVFLATGQGWLRGSTPDDKRQPFEARWTRRLHFRPDDGLHLLSVEGEAHVLVPGRGALDAGEIHLWLSERPAEPTAVAVKPNASPRAATEPGAEPSPAKVELIPDRLQAVERVRIASPQLTGNVNKLQGWFDHLPLGPRVPPVGEGPAFPVPRSTLRPPLPAEVPPAENVPPPPVVPDNGPRLVPAGVPMTGVRSVPPPAAEGVSAPPPVPQGAAPVGVAPPPAEAVPAPTFAPAPAAPPQPLPVPATPAAPPQQFQVDGELLRMRIRLGGPTAEVTEVVVEQNVQFTETRTKSPSELPLRVTGRQLHLVQPSPEAAEVTVTGQPAHVEARGMTLDSDVVHLHRGQNSLWTDGPGVMTFPVDRDLNGKPTGEPRRLNVTWQGNMHFDGRAARYLRGVVAQQPLQIVRTEELEVVLSRPVQFGAANDGVRPEIDTVTCRNGVFLESQTYEGAKLASIDRLRTFEISVHQPTGDLRGAGPGQLTSVRLDLGDKPLVGGAGPAAAAAPQAPAAAAAARGEGLVYIGVQFQRAMSGNLRRRDLVFENQVRTIYGPVPTWDALLDPDHPETWGPRGVLMTSDRLNVSEMGSSQAATRWHELEATGNTLVEGANFTARSARLTYSQAKELLVLEGNGRTDARLFRQTRVGGAPSEAAARKILYWPATNRAEVDDARFLDLSELPGRK